MAWGRVSGKVALGWMLGDPNTPKQEEEWRKEG